MASASPAASLVDEGSGAACWPRRPAAPASPGSPDAGEARGEIDGGAPASPCPDDMVPVDTIFCPDVERRCLDMEHEDINNLDICHAFAHEQRCRIRPRRIAFCIDRYEYPNRAGAHPTWMLDWYQAQATCESKGKRLCYASEWTAACEGPEHTPFPYGWERDHNKCNIDNFFIEPRSAGPNGAVPLLLEGRRRRSASSRASTRACRAERSTACTSGFGVHDHDRATSTSGSRATSRPARSRMWSGLKGGAWGHVRSQCRPDDLQPRPEFAYYFVGFRCCQRRRGRDRRWTPSPQAMRRAARRAPRLRAGAGRRERRRGARRRRSSPAAATRE